MDARPDYPLAVGPSLADQAFNVLRGLITTGQLPPGERLTERGLASRLGVSPTPVREAISRLLHERLLVRVDGRLLQVATLTPRRLREMSLIHAALQGVAAHLAADAASELELDEIEAAHVHSLATRADAQRVAADPAASRLRHEFHELIVQASHNPSLIDMIATAEAFGRTLRTQAQASTAAGESIQRAEQEHVSIVAALRARDGGRAEVLLREHTLWINEGYVSFAEQHAAAEVAAARS
jgi:DNA-binding GntR family transcriptional regulator